MTDKTAMEIRMWEEPGDHTCVLVYADCVEEMDQPELASNVRSFVRDVDLLRSGQTIDPYFVPPCVLRSVVRAGEKPKERIDTLNPFQESLLPWLAKSWLDTGLATGPSDESMELWGIQRAYRAAGLDEPKIKVWLPGPLHGSIGACLLDGIPVFGDQVWNQVRNQVRAQVGAQVWDQVWNQVRDQVGAQVEAQVGAQVRAQVWNQVWNQVGDQVRAQVGDQVWNQVRAQVGDQVGAQVEDQVGAQVRNQVGAQVGAQVGDQVWNRCYGQHDAGWLSFYATFSIFNKCETDPLLGLFALASTGWVWTFKNAVIFTTRPERIAMKNGKLKYIRYADGLEIDHSKKKVKV